MKKLMLMIAIAVCLMATPAFSYTLGGAQVVSSSTGTATLTVISTDIVYTTSIPLNRSEIFGLWIQAVSATGTPDIKVELQESYRSPLTEGAADSSFVEPDGFSDIYSSLTTETAHVVPLSPAPMPYIRLKITGNAANPADTIVTLYIFTQGNI